MIWYTFPDFFLFPDFSGFFSLFVLCNIPMQSKIGNCWFLWDLIKSIENLKHNEMLDPLGQAWQNGSASAAKTPDRATVNKHRICGSLFFLRILFLLEHPNRKNLNNYLVWFITNHIFSLVFERLLDLQEGLTDVGFYHGP